MNRTALVTVVTAAVELTRAAVALLLMSHVHEHEAQPPALSTRF